MTSSWFFLTTLNYDARSTTHQIYMFVCVCSFSVLPSPLQDIILKCCVGSGRLTNTVSILPAPSADVKFCERRQTENSSCSFHSDWTAATMPCTSPLQPLPSPTLLIKGPLFLVRLQLAADDSNLRFYKKKRRVAAYRLTTGLQNLQKEGKIAFGWF